MAKKEQANVTMRVRIGDSELEVTGPIDFVEKKIAEFREHQKTTPLAGSTITPPLLPTQTSHKSTKGMSAAQFFKKISPKSDADRVLAAGYFLEKYKNEESFTAAELSHIIQKEAKTPPPKNSNDVVNGNIRKGYMMAAGDDKDGKKAFVLTTDGEEAIETSLNA